MTATAAGLLPAWASGAAPVPVPADGAILSQRSCPDLPRHDQLDDFGRFYFDAASWEAVRTDGVTCRRLTYASGGHEVEGFALTPPGPPGPLPAIIYNRGGTGDFGRIDVLLLAEMRVLAAQGFVVVGSSYRFVGELARRDEWGGADLDDVMNPVPLLQARPDVDRRNLFMVGLSRGGVMTYLALKRGATVNAAAVIAGPSDLTRWAVDRPEFVLGYDEYDGWARVWPDFVTRGKEQLEARSAVFWPEKLRQPVLILHARTDHKVPVEHALALAQRLQQAGAEYELVVYGDDGHSLPRHRADRTRRIVEWFRGHSVR